MKTYIQFWVIATLLLFDNALADNAFNNKFDVDFYSVVKISEYQKFHKPTTDITDIEKKKLIEAKSTLRVFLAKLDKADNAVLELLDESIKRNYANSVELFAKEFSPSEAILDFEIFDFSISNTSKRITLRYFLTVMNEGDVCTQQMIVSLIQKDEKWFVADFK